METRTIRCWVNGAEQTRTVDIRMSLLDMLRDLLHLRGTKQGCGVGECGACTVIVEDRSVDACLFLAVRADGKRIRTIEGEEREGKLSRVQEAFLQTGAIQCGFCTPGFVMQATALLESGQDMDRKALRRMISGNMCRCTGYQSIVDACEKARGPEREETP